MMDMRSTKLFLGGEGADGPKRGEEEGARPGGPGEPATRPTRPGEKGRERGRALNKVETPLSTGRDCSTLGALGTLMTNAPPRPKVDIRYQGRPPKAAPVLGAPKTQERNK